MSSPTRRLQISFARGQQQWSLAEFFRTVAAYGLVEEVEWRSEAHYGQCHVTVQYQKMSSAEDLFADSGTGRWEIQFRPPVPCTAATLLLSCSCDGIPQGVQQRITSTGGLWEEKLSEVPDGAATLSSGSKAPRSVWEVLRRAVETVQRHTAGARFGLLRFPDAHQAHQFLMAHQLALAKESGVMATYQSPSIQSAAECLLRRTAPSDVAVGEVLRGLVLRRPPDQTCVVDAGVRHGSGSGSPVLLSMSAKAQRVGVGDEVLITLTVAQRVWGRSATPQGRVWWTGALVRVVAEAASSAIEKRDTPLSEVLQQLQPARRTPSAASPQGSGGMPSELLKRIRASPGERLARYEAPFRLYGALLLEAQRVERSGITARLLAVDEVPLADRDSAPPVFLPTAYLQDPSQSIVPGEHLRATLLYLVRVGGSEATRRVIASLRELDMSRCTATKQRRREAVESGAVLGVGLRLQGSLALELFPEDVGVPSSSSYFPAYLIRPSARAPLAAWGLPVILPVSNAAGHSAATLLDLVVADVVDSTALGHFAVVATPEAFQEREAAAKATVREQDSSVSENLALMRSIVAAALQEREEESLRKKSRLE